LYVFSDPFALSLVLDPEPPMPALPPNAPSSTPPYRYNATLANEIEQRWQRTWDENLTFRQPNPGEHDFDARKPKFYCLDMFPYPSGAGLHVGHPEGYTATDIISRFKRMKGFNVLHPMGWDAFGLPAEQYAIQTGIHPAITTRNSIDNFRRQLKRFGFSYDWTREFGTIDEDYYTWTQWIFLRLYDAWFDPSSSPGHDVDASAVTDSSSTPAGRARPIADLIEMLESGDAAVNMFGELVIHGAHPNVLTGEPVGLRQWHELTEQEREDFLDSQRLAYRDEMIVNWCPKLGTVLANDEVTAEGLSERGGFPVLRKPLRQWVFRITAYAERLLRQLDALDWPESTKAMQREWIGRSEGAEIDFALANQVSSDAPDQVSSLRVFTTRPDTVFGATYMVVAPEHELCDAVIAGQLGVDEVTREALRAYVAWAKNRSDIERQEGKDKTGVFTGVHAINPASGERIPVWTADYVLTGYGTGAIMAVPAHDERDFAFAQKFRLPIRDVIYPRAVHAMKYFSDHAYPDGNPSATWRDELADFLGLVVSAHATEPFDVALCVIRDRRRGTPPGTMTGVALDQPGALGEQRGATRAVWLETLDDLDIASFTDLCHRFREATYYANLGESYDGPGTGVNSANDEVSLNGLAVAEAKIEIVKWLQRKGLGTRKINYRLRDWVFSRQRYWGEPFPIVYDEKGRAYPISESHLPVRLPELADYAPVESDDPQPLLAKATAWVHTTAGAAGVDPKILPPETPVTRETNTMPGSAGSSWYAIRYCDARNASRFVGAEAERYWMGPRDGAPVGGVDLYLGGSEHAVGHLLYARFWQNVLFDLGYCSTPEPFRKLFHQGLITSFAYQRPDKSLVPVDLVREVADGKFVEVATGKPVAQITAKMSKSLKNVVNPDDVIAEYGADTFRLYEMYMGPLDASKPWNPRDIGGLHRFLQRTWRVLVSEETGHLRLADAPDMKLERLLHRLIAKVEHDIERLAFNTAIATMIEFVNAATAADPTAAGGGSAAQAGSSRGVLTREQVRRFVLALAPFVPHLAEEVWRKLGHASSVTHAPWPDHDEAMLRDQEVEIPISLMGKVKSRVVVPADADAKVIEAAALAEPKIVELLAGKPIKKVIVVPGKMVNIVHG
jgi:leucyl-tRNA synthetase